MILYFCSNYVPQSEKKVEFDHRKKLVSLQVKKRWKKLENHQRDFQKFTSCNTNVFHSFPSSKGDAFCNVFHLFSHRPSETVFSFCVISRKSTRKKTQKTLFGRFIDPTDAHVFAKKLFLIKFPELFLRRLRKTKVKCDFKGARCPSLLKKYGFLQVYWHVWTSVFWFPRPKCLSFCRGKNRKSTVFWSHFVAFQRFCTASEDL